jgi:hypothetical protein
MRRPCLYALLSLSFVCAFFYFLSASTKPDLVFMRGVGAPYLVGQSSTSESLLTNKFTLKIKHQGSVHYEAHLTVMAPHHESAIQLQLSENPIKLNLAEKKLFVFFKFPKSILTSGSKVITVQLRDVNTSEVLATKEVTLVGPME